MTTPTPVPLTPAGFEELAQRIRPELHRYATRMTGSVIDGEDVVQEALMKANASRRRFMSTVGAGAASLALRPLYSRNYLFGAPPLPVGHAGRNQDRAQRAATHGVSDAGTGFDTATNCRAHG